jgi:hypothetical protein
MEIKLIKKMIDEKVNKKLEDTFAGKQLQTQIKKI